MQENRNGTFGEPFELPADEVARIKTLSDKIAEAGNNLAAMHIGTPEQLREVKRKKRLEKRLDALEEGLDALQSRRHPMAPTPEELRRLQSRIK